VTEVRKRRPSTKDDDLDGPGRTDMGSSQAPDQQEQSDVYVAPSLITVRAAQRFEGWHIGEQRQAARTDRTMALIQGGFLEIVDG
jgi:hypothetical protein